MCGIVGIINRDRQAVEPAVLADMAHAIDHRGPDGEGELHRRSGRLLSQAAGHHRPRHGRPAHDAWDRSRSCSMARSTTTWSCARNCIRRGHTFHTTSDTEVILAMYAAYGPDCVKALNGMFAFLLYDRDAPNGVRRPRSLRHQAAVLLRVRPAHAVRVGDQGAAAASRPSRASRTSTRSASTDVPVRDRASDTMFAGHPQAAPRPLADDRSRLGRRVRDARILGAAVQRSIRTTPRSTSSSKCADCSRMRSGCSSGATCPSARISAAVWTRAS